MKKRFQPKFNIKKGDSVVVIAGDDRDRSQPRVVQAVYPRKGLVLVEGVNIITKHLKPNAQNPQGGIVKQEAPVNISNVMLWDAKSKAPVRIKRERKEGSFVRISKKTGEVIK
ncbi:MAG: 50S ribosomal protein L24 [Chitinophagaceae bacterium]|uniref:Large ribosomal subunit protein uL24 n=1 Tax=Rurimicrobium arvi TaxID=2049916 RepID=A0ABP8MKT7_9BACT